MPRNTDILKLKMMEPPAKKAKVTENRSFLPKWKRDFSWLLYDEKVNKMTCAICSKNPALAGKTAFVTGTDHFKKETLQYHARSKNHIAARDAQLCKQGKVAGQASIQTAFQQQRQEQSSKDNVDLKCKINTAYVLAKEELPFTKFRPLLDLQKKNGLAVSSTYANHVKAAELVHTIAETLKDEVSYLPYVFMPIFVWTYPD